MRREVVRGSAGGEFEAIERLRSFVAEGAPQDDTVYFVMD